MIIYLKYTHWTQSNSIWCLDNGANKVHLTLWPNLLKPARIVQTRQVKKDKSRFYYIWCLDIEANMMRVKFCPSFVVENSSQNCARPIKLYGIWCLVILCQQCTCEMAENFGQKCTDKLKVYRRLEKRTWLRQYTSTFGGASECKKKE